MNKIEIESNSKIQQLVDYCISDKTLSISNERPGLDIVWLLEKQIIEKDSFSDKNSYKIANSDDFADSFLKQFQKQQNFILINEFRHTIDFLLEIQNLFTKDDVRNTYTFRIQKIMWKRAIVNYNKEYDLSFEDIKNALNDKNLQQIFWGAFVDAMPKIRITPADLYNILVFLYDILKQPDVYSMEINRYNENLYKIAEKNLIFIYDLFDYIVQQDIIEGDFLVNTITVLYYHDRKQFYNNKIKSLLPDNKALSICVFGLSNVKKIEKNDALLFLDLYENIGKTDEILRHLPALLAAIIKSEEIKSEETIINECFEKLDTLLEKNTEAQIFVILQALKGSKDFDRQKTDLILKIMEQPCFDIQKYQNVLEWTLYSIKDIICIEQILRHLAKYTPFMYKNENLFYHFLSQVVGDIGFQKVLIDMLIDNNPKIRFLAYNIFQQFYRKQNYRNYTIWSFDILSLSAIEQYKLWVSMFDNYGEPKDKIPFLLPLLNSGYDIVKTSFICKLEEQSEEYGTTISEVLEKELDANVATNQKIIDRIKKYQTDFYSNNIKIKQDIKELNPYYTHQSLFQNYIYNHHKRMSMNIDDMTSDNSLLSSLVAKKTILAKGGGWKLKNRPLSKLGKIEHSFQLPRSFFISSSDYERYINDAITENWEHSFDNIQNFIDNDEQ